MPAGGHGGDYPRMISASTSCSARRTSNDHLRPLTKRRRRSDRGGGGIEHGAVRDRVVGRTLTWSWSARMVPPCVTTRIRYSSPCAPARCARSPRAHVPDAPRATRRRRARRRTARRGVSERVRPDHEPMSISRRPGSATTSTGLGSTPVSNGLEHPAQVTRVDRVRTDGTRGGGITAAADVLRLRSAGRIERRVGPPLPPVRSPSRRAGARRIVVTPLT